MLSFQVLDEAINVRDGDWFREPCMADGARETQLTPQDWQRGPGARRVGSKAATWAGRALRTPSATRLTC